MLVHINASDAAMRRQYYLKLRGNFSYFRLNKESGCVESDEQRWRATGRTDREAAEQYVVNFMSDSLRAVIPTHLAAFREYSMPFFIWDECPHIRRVFEETGKYTKRYARIQRLFRNKAQEVG